MVPKALKEFIRQEDVRRKIEWDVNENTALNIVHNFLKDGHLDEEMQSLIRRVITFTDSLTLLR